MTTHLTVPVHAGFEGFVAGVSVLSIYIYSHFAVLVAASSHDSRLIFPPLHRSSMLPTNNARTSNSGSAASKGDLLRSKDKGLG